MHKKTRSILLLIFILFNLISADIFNPYNRLELSSEYLDAVHSSIINKTHLFYSLNNFKNTETQNLFSLSSKKDSITFNTNTLINSSYHNNLTAFLLTSPVFDYNSKYLDMHFKADIYTCDANKSLDPIFFETQRIFSEVEHMHGVKSLDFNIYEAFLKIKLNNFNIYTGKKKMRWGPGYKGTLIYSGSSDAPLFYYNVNTTLFNQINYSSFFAGLDDEYLYIKEWKTSEYRNTKNNYPPARYLSGHKLTLKINEHLQLGYNEIAVLYGESDVNRFFSPLIPIYIGNLRSNTNNANLLISIDYNAIISSFRIYGEILNDDITYWDERGNPNKFGFQQGIIHYMPGKIKEMGIEYTHIHYYVYGHSRPLSKYIFWNFPLGWPYGNDQDLLCLFLRAKPIKNFEIRFELEYFNKGIGTLYDDWTDDGKPNLDNSPYWVNDGTVFYGSNIKLNYKFLNYFISSLYTSIVFDKKGNIDTKIDIMLAAKLF